MIDLNAQNNFSEKLSSTQALSPFKASEYLNKLLEYGRNNSQERLTQDEVLKICHYAKQSFEQCRNVVELYAPVKVMGIQLITQALSKGNSEI